MSDQPTQDAKVPQRVDAFERLKHYPDYIDDPEGLERLRRDVKSSSGHDMAALNYNSLGRLIDTIERLRHDRAKVEAATIEWKEIHNLAMAAGNLVVATDSDERLRPEREAVLAALVAIRNLKGQTP